MCSLPNSAQHVRAAVPAARKGERSALEIYYEAGKGSVNEKLADIVEAIDLQDAAEIGEEEICRLKRAMLGDGSYARLTCVRLLGGGHEEY